MGDVSGFFAVNEPQQGKSAHESQKHRLPLRILAHNGDRLQLQPTLARGRLTHVHRAVDPAQRRRFMPASALPALWAGLILQHFGVQHFGLVGVGDDQTIAVIFAHDFLRDAAD